MLDIGGHSMTAFSIKFAFIAMKAGYEGAAPQNSSIETRHDPKPPIAFSTKDS
jgi:hypothetical protein